MKRRVVLAAGAAAYGIVHAQLPSLDGIVKGLDKLPKPAGAKDGSAAAPPPAVDDKTGAAGIKEALAVSTERAVQSLGRKDGYFGNAAVKILMPSGLQKAADVAAKVGYQKQVDEFVLSMNRAAEAAAPLAAKYFADAIRGMTLQDVHGILMGGDTAATEFFRRKTHDDLFAAFKPVVSKKVDEVGATRAYQDLVKGFGSLPMGAGKQSSLDLDEYVTNKSLDGLFHTVGVEEKKIRTNPAARSTELLKTVFGK